MESEVRHERMIHPIGIIRSCFGEKFGTPRQPGLVPDSWAELVFGPQFRNPDMLRGLDGFSHLWILFGFHQTLEAGWHPTVRPPRLGGNHRVGVFASRSTHRPNGIGLSVARLLDVTSTSSDGPRLHLGGIDLVDGSPVYDIKPYLPYADSIPKAVSGYATGEIPRLRVSVAPAAYPGFEAMDQRSQLVVMQSLALDPRPATSGSQPERVYGIHLCGHNIRFRIDGSDCEICEISAIEPVA